MAFEVDNITFYYEDKKVIDALSVVLESGKFYGILGPNGCGKTTLIDLLLKHSRPSTGKINYKGKDLSHYSRKELSREIALVPQNFYINFPFTAKEVVMMGRYPHMPRFSVPTEVDLELVQDIMEKTDTYQFAHRFITELSGGERQRVVFARALAQDTPVLILDEATSNLDIHHTIRLLNIASERVEKDKKTIIAVLQDINLAAAFCDDLIFMKQGSIAACGNSDEVLNREIIHSIFNVETKIYYEPYSNAKQVIFKR
ncbi:MAG: ABC transporter ATP-binding protein [Desulfobacterales bacterium]|nr:ABC transporter ATP-binding protein [Desulfobacterales bacterium]